MGSQADDMFKLLELVENHQMPRGHKKDNTDTAARNFHSDDSFISMDGREFLAGEDWRDQKFRVFTRDMGKCRDCGTAWLWIADVHHVIRRSKGGSDDLDNLITLCRDCHNKRHPEKQVRWTGGSNGE